MRIYAGNTSEFADGTFKPVWLGQHCVGVGSIGGRVVAFLSECPHRGAQLLKGEVHADVITCPWHGWEFGLPSGQGLTNPHARLEMYPVFIEAGGKVYIDVPDHWT
ncbi:MAG: Rieske (2Fe-2S) protein [Candidatus Sumerlaeaceae bacterium]|nr:Rieske (2Fe-2S) protein [Candidatus Sumerlaeaceae bacterium]